MIEVKRYDLRFNQGSRFELPINVTESGVTKDLTNWTARMQIRQFKDSATVLADYTILNGRITVNGPTGRVTVLVPASVTDGYEWGDGVYDLEIVAPDGDAIRIMEGTVSFSKQVTR
jgi:hypothetical protein